MKDRTVENSDDKGRRDRVPFGSHRRRLAVHKKDPGYVYYWFNDTEDRLQRALAAGYEFVTRKMLGGTDVGDKDVNNQNQSLDSRVSKRVNGSLTTYLMRIKKEFYEEDQAAKQKDADEVDKAIFSGGADKVQNSYGLDVRYQPNRK